jgi:hypothetical protein
VIFGHWTRRRLRFRVLEYSETDTERIWVVEQRCAKDGAKLAAEPQPFGARRDHGGSRAEPGACRRTAERSTAKPRPGNPASLSSTTSAAALVASAGWRPVEAEVPELPTAKPDVNEPAPPPRVTDSVQPAQPTHAIADGV